MAESGPDSPIDEQDNPPRAGRFVRLAINALTVGLILTMVLALVVLWLEKRSGITLDREQYRGLLIIILAAITLSAYVVLEFFQHRREVAQAKLQSRRKRPRRKDDRAFVPIFAEPAAEIVQPALLPAAAPEAEAPTDGEEKADAAPFQPTGVSPSANQTALAVVAVNDASAALFVQTVNAAVAGLDEPLSPFVQFGLHLFVMGACGELARRNGVAPAPGRKMLTGMLSDLGLGKRSAAALAASANTFAQVPHFRAPIDAGYRAMAHLQEAGFLGMGEFLDALTQWRLQENLCQPPEPTTFLATALGVAAGLTPEDRQRVMHAHNTFVSAALERFRGREILNMGTGIIASFADAGLALRAAENCLENLDLFARENPTLIVVPRIGIDTKIAAVAGGVAISAGMTRVVTIAALTPVDHIYCSEATCDEAGLEMAFEPVGQVGDYTDLPPLFSVTWSRLPAKGGATLEYRQIGTMADAS